MCRDVLLDEGGARMLRALRLVLEREGCNVGKTAGAEGLAMARGDLAMACLDQMLPVRPRWGR